MFEEIDRKNCPMRKAENGNCLIVGGFCTAVPYIFCEIAHKAYRCGYFDNIPTKTKAKQKDGEPEKNCLTCRNSFSDEEDHLHCMADGHNHEEIVADGHTCKHWC